MMLLHKSLSGTVAAIGGSRCPSRSCTTKWVRQPVRRQIWKHSMRISRIREHQAGAHSQERPCGLSRSKFRFVHPPAHTAYLWPISDAVYSGRSVAFTKSLEASMQVTQLSHICICLCWRVGLELLTNFSVPIGSTNFCVASEVIREMLSAQSCAGHTIMASGISVVHFRSDILDISEASRHKMKYITTKSLPPERDEEICDEVLSRQPFFQLRIAVSAGGIA